MKLKVAITSLMSMVVAMGLGRFALTPQLPHMIDEGQINLTQASLVAAANFLGYLIGAVDISRARHQNLILRLMAGIWGTVAILLLSALIPNGAFGLFMNLFLRFAAGIASAWVLILISTWLQHELSGDHALRTLAFSGPGVGIIATGLLAVAFDLGHTKADDNWFVFGIVGLMATALIAHTLPKTLPEVSTETKFTLSRSIQRMVVVYVLCAIGYVLPATFLSKLAADQFPNSLMADAFWPLFGLAVLIGMAVLAAQKRIQHPQRWLAAIFIVQGLGNVFCLVPGIIGLLIGALFVGGTFIAIMQLMMQLGQQLAPRHLRTITGVLTIGFAIGQFIGPLLSAASTHWYSSMAPALATAAAGSFVAAALIITIK